MLKVIINKLSLEYMSSGPSHLRYGFRNLEIEHICSFYEIGKAKCPKSTESLTLVLSLKTLFCTKNQRIIKTDI